MSEKAAYIVNLALKVNHLLIFKLKVSEKAAYIVNLALKVNHLLIFKLKVSEKAAYIVNLALKVNHLLIFKLQVCHLCQWQYCAPARPVAVPYTLRFCLAFGSHCRFSISASGRHRRFAISANLFLPMADIAGWW